MKLIDSLRRSGFQLVLIDQNNYHQFQPLLYQVATAGLNPGSIAFPFRKDFRHIPDFHFRMARVTRIVLRENQIETTIGSLGYDYLVIAAGTTTNYYGMQNIQAHALPMKSVTEAMALRNHILTKSEEALTADVPRNATVAQSGGSRRRGYRSRDFGSTSRNETLCIAKRLSRPHFCHTPHLPRRRDFEGIRQHVARSIRKGGRFPQPDGG